MWICDGGCGFRTEDPDSAEATEHYTRQSNLPVDQVVCWGLYEEGSPTHLAHTVGVVHPMMAVLGAVAEAALDHAQLFQGRMDD